MLPLLGAPRPGLRPRPRRHPRGNRGRAAVDLALRRPAAGRASARAAPRARPDPACPGRPARRRGRSGRALAEARHGEPDALVQGPRRRRRDGQGAGARPDHDRLLVHRQPRERGRRAGGRRGPRGRRLLPGRPRAREADRDRRLRRDALQGRRHVRRLQPHHDRALLGGRLGVRQRRPAQLLRRGLEDDRVRDRRAARLADARRRRLADRLRFALHQAEPGLHGAA